MATQNKTQANANSYKEYLQGIENTSQKSDAEQLVAILKSCTGEQPVMWGTSIVGFGSRHYKYDSGREGDTLVIGFSVRKVALVIYGLLHDESNVQLLDNLGKYSRGKGCVYIKRLSDIDLAVFKQLARASYRAVSVG